MSADWKGMDQKSTPVYPDATLATVAQNQRFRVKGEMQRRPGLAASNLTKLSDPILSMYGGADYSGYLITQTTGTLTGDRDPAMLWGDVRIIPPTVLKGNPVAPVVNFVIFTPTSPPATYIIGVVTMAANITYDGLSGALSYSWSTPSSGFANAANITTNANPASFDFDASCTPGAYNYTLTVTTALNGFVTNFPDTYTVL